MFWKKGNSKKDIFEKQISAINVWTTIMGLTFLLVFGGIGYLQFKSAGELSDTLKEMKKDMKDYTEAYEKALSQNLNRIDNLESRIQSQVNREVDDMREKFKETIGDAPEPAEVELMIDGNVVKSTPYLIKTGQAPENYRQLYFPALSLKNIGGKQTGEIIIYCTIHYVTWDPSSYSDVYPRATWDQTSNVIEKKEGANWVLKLDTESIRYLSAGETWTLKLPEGYADKKTTNASIDFEIFYAAEASKKVSISFEILN